MLLITAFFSPLAVAEEPLPNPQALNQESLEGEPTIFREVGTYRITKSVLVSLGNSVEIDKGEVRLCVYTDGIDVRVCQEGKEDYYLAFQICRSAGIYDHAGENLRPGVEAFSDQGQVVRQLVVDGSLLTIKKFPASTHDIEITYATRDE